eukprot:233068-Pyramimonas_sp.AAC.1
MSLRRSKDVRVLVASSFPRTSAAEEAVRSPRCGPKGPRREPKKARDPSEVGGRGNIRLAGSVLVSRAWSGCASHGLATFRSHACSRMLLLSAIRARAIVA